MLGNYYLSMIRELAMARSRATRSLPVPEEAMLAYDIGELDIHEPITVRLPHRADMARGHGARAAHHRSCQDGMEHGTVFDGAMKKLTAARASGRNRCRAATLKYCTTVGRLIQNQILPERLKYTDKYLLNTMKKKQISEVISDVTRRTAKRRRSTSWTSSRPIGFKYAMKAGITISMTDMDVPEERNRIISETEAEVIKNNKQYDRGRSLPRERKSRCSISGSGLRSGSRSDHGEP